MTTNEQIEFLLSTNPTRRQEQLEVLEEMKKAKRDLREHSSRLLFRAKFGVYDKETRNKYLVKSLELCRLADQILKKLRYISKHATDAEVAKAAVTKYF